MKNLIVVIFLGHIAQPT